MLADELKEHTRLVHAELEKKLLTHIQVVNDADSYAELLRLMYGYYAALEEKLESFEDHLPEFRTRRKSAAILRDLHILASPASDLPICEDVPHIDCPAAALGAMYVLEGSTLGGKIISKMLLKQVPSLDGATTFFQGYQEETPAMWHKFKDHLHSSVDQTQAEKAHRAANETFVKFKNWLEYHDAEKL